jgi:hypothetical protein
LEGEVGKDAQLPLTHTKSRMAAGGAEEMLCEECEQRIAPAESSSPRHAVPVMTCASCHGSYHPGCLGLTEEQFAAISRSKSEARDCRAHRKTSALRNWVCPKPGCGGPKPVFSQPTLSQTPRCHLCSHRLEDPADSLLCATGHRVHRFCSGYSKLELKKRAAGEPFFCFKCRREPPQPLPVEGGEEQVGDGLLQLEEEEMELEEPREGEKGMLLELGRLVAEEGLPEAWEWRLREAEGAQMSLVFARAAWSTTDSLVHDLQLKVHEFGDISVEVSCNY